MLLSPAQLRRRVAQTSVCDVSDILMPLEAEV